MHTRLPRSVSSVHMPPSYLEARCNTLMEDDVEIDSRFAADVSIP